MDRAAEDVGTAAPARRVRDGVFAFWRKGYEDGLTGLAGMVAYNLMLSVFPFALVALFIGGRVLRSQEVQQSVLADLTRIFPTAAESTLSEGIRRLQRTSPTVGIVALVASIWFGSSFWGALDTAFCRIYRCECRTWVRQKVFALGMFAIALLFVVASISVPTIQALLISTSRDLPFGLSKVQGLVYWATLTIGVALLFAALCATYRLVPKARMPWRAVWPGALGASIAMAIVDLCFPIYLDNVSTLRIGTSAVFVLIALVWFYTLALILLAGAVVNDLRYAGARGSLRGMPDPITEELRLEQLQRARRETDQAREADLAAQEKAHDRRADKADYLREKLAERAKAEDEAAERD